MTEQQYHPHAEPEGQRPDGHGRVPPPPPPPPPAPPRRPSAVNRPAFNARVVSSDEELEPFQLSEHFATDFLGLNAEIGDLVERSYEDPAPLPGSGPGSGPGAGGAGTGGSHVAHTGHGRGDGADPSWLMELDDSAGLPAGSDAAGLADVGASQRHPTSYVEPEPQAARAGRRMLYVLASMAIVSIAFAAWKTFRGASLIERGPGGAVEIDGSADPTVHLEGPGSRPGGATRLSIERDGSTRPAPVQPMLVDPTPPSGGPGVAEPSELGPTATPRASGTAPRPAGAVDPGPGPEALAALETLADLEALLAEGPPRGTFEDFVGSPAPAVLARSFDDVARRTPYPIGLDGLAHALRRLDAGPATDAAVEPVAVEPPRPDPAAPFADPEPAPFVSLADLDPTFDRYAPSGHPAGGESDRLAWSRPARATEIEVAPRVAVLPPQPGSASSARAGALERRLAQGERSALDLFHSRVMKDERAGAPLGGSLTPLAGARRFGAPPAGTPFAHSTLGGALEDLPLAQLGPGEGGSGVDLGPVISVGEIPEISAAGGPQRRLRLASEEARDHWFRDTVPEHLLGAAERYFTPNVGWIRVHYANGEYFEGLLTSIGRNTIWMDTSLGRMTLDGGAVSEIEHLAPVGSSFTPGAHLTALPKVRVESEGGITFVGRLLSQQGTLVTLLTDQGNRITLESDEVMSASIPRPTVGIRRRIDPIDPIDPIE